MSRNKNPFEAMANMYKEFVEREDKKGLAEVYKEATKLTFKKIKKELKQLDIVTKVTNIQYLDGYFIFGTGTNSVVHFYLDCTPGWKYGIWWSPVETKDSTEDDRKYEINKLHCSIFTQFEEEIDKFKPSASTYHRNFNITFSENENCFEYDFNEFVRDIKFIHKEPYLAFYREMRYCDFNQEHITREEAKEYYDKHFDWKRKSEEVKIQNDKELLSTLYNVFKEDIDSGDMFIQDRGECWSPRYDLIGKNTFTNGEVEDGCYGICDLLENGEEIQKIIDNKVKECEDRADEAETLWFACCHDSIDIISPKEYDKFYNKCKKVEFNEDGEPLI